MVNALFLNYLPEGFSRQPKLSHLFLSHVKIYSKKFLFFYTQQYNHDQNSPELDMTACPSSNNENEHTMSPLLCVKAAPSPLIFTCV